MKLEKNEGGIQHYIFTDSDIAVVDDIGTIFDKHTNFHIALTFRNNKDQPLNSGFIAVRGTREGILRFGFILFSPRLIEAKFLTVKETLVSLESVSEPGMKLRWITEKLILSPLKLITQHVDDFVFM